MNKNDRIKQLIGHIRFDPILGEDYEITSARNDIYLSAAIALYKNDFVSEEYFSKTDCMKQIMMAGQGWLNPKMIAEVINQKWGKEDE
jgi:hypothetical protein